MDVTSIAMMAMAANAAQLQSSLGVAMVKQQNEMAQSMVAMLDASVESARAAAPAGMGQLVDIMA
ncbi:hypothetical protein [Methylobrevis albus]|uniref:Motility protein n=1 Tax=Methylobrevis albus TaxID=2793297 RepID=A0A931I0W7_9HYPH|nr:hypothetical protein [Methylobrevis albus]MBH0237211.1 hypothetical protein [Methylobrevis albus]